MSLSPSEDVHPRRSTLVLFWLGIFILIATLAVVYYRVYHWGNFYVRSEVPCDPMGEQCFVRQCEDSCETSDKSFYKVQTVSARYASTCNPLHEECPPIDCANTPTCSEELCDETNAPIGETCNNPEEFQKIQEENTSISENTDE